MMTFCSPLLTKFQHRKAIQVLLSVSKGPLFVAFSVAEDKNSVSTCGREREEPIRCGVDNYTGFRYRLRFVLSITFRSLLLLCTTYFLNQVFWRRATLCLETLLMSATKPWQNRGPKEDYSFFQSTVRARTEIAFEMLTRLTLSSS